MSAAPPSLALVTSAEYLRHETGHHPENAGRLRALQTYIHETGLTDVLPVIAPRPATDTDLLAVHARRHLTAIADLARQGGGMIDADTVVSVHSDDVARLAAGGALAAVDAVIRGGQDAAGSAFVLARPPGHHAMHDRAMGFCLYNSVAIATRYAQQTHGLNRVLILDWDVHHGNGTQSIFDDDPSVLFISLHQFPLWPPGWGWLDQVGTGSGAGYTVNVPLPPGEGDATYQLACERIVRPIAAAFRPELVLVSAGQDGHVADPISTMALTAAGFTALGRLARAIAREAGAYGPVLILEGGYNVRTLPYLCGAVINGCADLNLDVRDPHAVHPRVSPEARARIDLVADTLRPWWRL